VDEHSQPPLPPPNTHTHTTLSHSPHKPSQHQADFDVVWAKGTVGELIFKPWVQQIQDLGANLMTGKR
jgi:hypothetical protein